MMGGPPTSWEKLLLLAIVAAGLAWAAWQSL